MMETSMFKEENPVIVKVIFILSDELAYSFDVNNTRKISSLKKLITTAAHLRKNSFRIYANSTASKERQKDETDYTDRDADVLKNIFPMFNKVYFHLKVDAGDEVEPFKTSSKINFSKYCERHLSYLIYYCFTCKKSICGTCMQEAHQDHYIIEKSEYLNDSVDLVNFAFKNDSNVNIDVNKLPVPDYLGLYINVLRNEQNFMKLIDLIKQIEMKCNGLISTYNDCLKVSANNVKENISNIRPYSANGLDALKNDIEINKIGIDEQLFLNFDNKFKKMVQTQSENAKKDLDNFKFFNEVLPVSIKTFVKNLYGEILNFLTVKLNDMNFSILFQSINEKIIKVRDENEILSMLLEEDYLMNSSENSKSKNYAHIKKLKKESSEFSLEVAGIDVGLKSDLIIQGKYLDSSNSNDLGLYINEKQLPNFIILLDCSGSMTGVAERYVKNIIPTVLENLDYGNKKVQLVTFADTAKFYEYGIEDFKTSQISAFGGTQLAQGLSGVEKLFASFNTNQSLRILTISDGAVEDKEEAIDIANKIYDKYYGKFPVYSRSIRIGKANADTSVFSQILRLNYPSKAGEILNVEKTDEDGVLIQKITNMFLNDGNENFKYLVSNSCNLRENPYSEYTDRIPFVCGGKTFNVLKRKDNQNSLEIQDKNGNTIDTFILPVSTVKVDSNILGKYSQGMIQKYVYDLKNYSDSAASEVSKIKEFVNDFEKDMPNKTLTRKLTRIDSIDISKLDENDYANLINEVILEESFNTQSN